MLATVLTIEDDVGIRKSIVAYLADRGYTVLEAENGRVGLEVFASRRPDLALLDLRMPEMDGLEVLANVTRDFPDTPIVVVSGIGVIGDAVEALHLGAWDFVQKPIEDMAILLHAVEKSLERATLISKDREHREHLEEEVRRQTLALTREIDERERARVEREKLIATLEEQNAELERFAYTVSHDLKSPLITIKGYLECCEKTWPKRCPNRWRMTLPASPTRPIRWTSC